MCLDFDKTGRLYQNYDKIDLASILGNRELNSGGPHQLQLGVMTIKRVEPADKGEYTCVAENVLGKIQKTLFIALSGK